MILQQVGKTIRARRLIAGYSIEELAHRSGIHRTTLINIEKGHSSAKIPTLYRIAAGLNVASPEEFLSDATREIFPLIVRERKENLD